MKFRGHRSSAFVMPIDSLALGSYSIDFNSLKEGDMFDSIDGLRICEKYQVLTKEFRGNTVRGMKKEHDRVEPKHFPEHLDSDNYFRNKHMFQDSDRVIVTQKLHGTSGRFGNIRVKRRLSYIAKIAKWLGVPVDEYEYDYIAGSRRVVKDVKSLREFNNYYVEDIWAQALERIKHVIPKDTVIYAEIIGWVGDSPIQKGYTYCYPKGDFGIYVYRIAHINQDGHSVDYSWDQVKHFCKQNDLRHCPEVIVKDHEDFKAEEYIDLKFADNFNHICLSEFIPLDPESPCDE
jgi:hypothetical protein